ncbi:GNAT family N-acetyltransferase [Avibacterium paragallinarum]|uniref:GNAT family N-acetyltransferase n=1 Tax=Avibacterium paragallinarum TaxID=728 RepID=UPI003986F102
MTQSHFILRQSRIEDNQEIENVIQEAFANMPFSDGKEALLVRRLYENNEVVLSLVAENEGKIIGHILFSPATIGQQPALALAPLSVLPQWQKQGVGKALILAAHQQLKNKEYAAIVVLGHPEYYSRFGYQTASHYGITAPFPLPEGVLRVLPFTEPPPQGEIIYAKAFNLN